MENTEKKETFEEREERIKKSNEEQSQKNRDLFNKAKASHAPKGYNEKKIEFVETGHSKEAWNVQLESARNERLEKLETFQKDFEENFDSFRKSLNDKFKEFEKTFQEQNGVIEIQEKSIKDLSDELTNLKNTLPNENKNSTN